MNGMFFPVLAFIVFPLCTTQDGADNSTKVDSLLSLSYSEFANVRPLESLNYATQALAKSEQMDYACGRAKSNFYIAKVLVSYGEYDKALKYIVKVEEDASAYENKRYFEADISRLKGQIYYYLGLYAASEKEFYKGLKASSRINEEQKRNNMTSLAYENLSFIYLNTGRLDSAFLFMKANESLLANVDETSVFRNKINLYAIIGNYYTRTENPDSAQTYYERALTIADRHNYPYTSWIYLRYGDLKATQGDDKAALSCYRKSLDNLRQTNLKNELGDVYGKIAAVFTRQNQTDSAAYYRNLAQNLEIELLSACNDAGADALNILLKEEQLRAQKRLWRIIIGISVVVLVLGVVEAVYLRRWGQKKQNALLQKDDEVEELKGRVNEKFDELVELARKNDSVLLPRFNEMYPEFVENIYCRYPDLLVSELEFCVLLFLNFSSKEIAQYRFVTHRSVQTRKGRLRKKLNIPSDTDLYVFIQGFYTTPTDKETP